MTDTAPRTDSWTVAGRTFNSRLIVGTGKYRDYAQNAAAAEASGAEIVTVAVRRVNLTDPNQPVLTDFIDAIEQDRPPLIDGIGVIKAHRLIDAILASAYSEKVIHVMA